MFTFQLCVIVFFIFSSLVIMKKKKKSENIHKFIMNNIHSKHYNVIISSFKLRIVAIIQSARVRGTLGWHRLLGYCGVLGG